MKRIACFMAAIAVFAVVSGCSKSGPVKPAAEEKKGPHIVFIFKVMGISYADSLQNGAKKASEELGVNAEVIGPATGGNIQDQIALIDDQIARKVDAIVVSPNDADSVVPALKRAKDAGIGVYTWDSDAPKSVREFYVAGCDDVQIGVDIAKNLAKDMGGKGKVAIMTGGLTANNLMLHVDGVREGLKAFPDIQVVEPLLACNDQKDQAIKQALTMLQKHPDLGGFAGVCSPAAPGIAEALLITQKQTKVKVWGLSLPSEIKDHVERDIIHGAILWDPSKLTYATAYLVREHLKSGALPKDGQEIPGVGKLSVKGSQATIPGVTITKDNVASFDF